MANCKYSQDTIKALYYGSRIKGIKHSFLATEYNIPSVSYVSDLIRQYEKTLTK